MKIMNKVKEKMTKIYLIRTQTRRKIPYEIFCGLLEGYGIPYIPISAEEMPSNIINSLKKKKVLEWYSVLNTYKVGENFVHGKSIRIHNNDRTIIVAFADKITIPWFILIESLNERQRKDLIKSIRVLKKILKEVAW